MNDFVDIPTFFKVGNHWVNLQAIDCITEFQAEGKAMIFVLQIGESRIQVSGAGAIRLRAILAFLDDITDRAIVRLACPNFPNEQESTSSDWDAAVDTASQYESLNKADYFTF
ncbi:hypothetical protein L3556_16015 [Candidatus Synechococcus calcipolaris G9]|uniref:Uncharacterized protein n=1 Tax=Candidatus Synechococcus calcipolaris G9 TaxID=1497997 RepID=A0ABT6F3J1_9SYNE|nr:hypothetical protein [Candidatus Synechococcus calcipolaris]MDG2992425.1 hypothetical protein [Candidatus Synechococcus calcipolaris G9]